MELIKSTEMGKYFRIKGRVIFLSNQDMEVDLSVKSIRSQFDQDWPAKWESIKESIPEGPFEFTSSKDFRKGMLISDPADMFLLTKADWLRLGLGDEHADKLMVAIGESKCQPLHKIVFGIGIRHIGRGNARILADKFGSLDILGRATWTEVIVVPGIGATIGTSVLDYFHSEDSWKLIEKLRLAGLDYAFGYQPTKEEVVPTSFDRFYMQWKLAEDLVNNLYPQLYEKAKELGVSIIQIHDSLEFGGPPNKINELLAWMKDKTDSILHPVKGKTFMFTGRLECYTRSQAQAKIESLGGISGSSVSSNTSYLVVGESPGSKLGKAVALGVKRISEEEFLDLLKEA